MPTIQFVVYNLTVLLIIAHFLDSAKEHEWTDTIYQNNYVFWLISSLILIAFALSGIVPVYLGNEIGNIISAIVALGGLGAAGYHIPMNRSGKSEVCHNRFSYCLMTVLSVMCLVLLVTLFA